MCRLTLDFFFSVWAGKMKLTPRGYLLCARHVILQVRRQRRCRGHGLCHLVGMTASSPQAGAQGEHLGAQSPGLVSTWQRSI